MLLVNRCRRDGVVHDSGIFVLHANRFLELRYIATMGTRVALLRGINVGGRNVLPIRDLRDILAMLGCERVATYIQSGNAVFCSEVESARLSRQITESVQKRFGFAPFVLVMSIRRFRSIAAELD